MRDVVVMTSFVTLDLAMSNLLWNFLANVNPQFFFVFRPVCFQTDF